MANSVLDNFREALNSVDGPSLNQYFGVNFGSSFGDQTFVNYIVRSTEVPGYTMNNITIPCQGLELKIADKPTFSEWNCTFLCTNNNSNVRNTLLNYMMSEYDLNAGQNKSLKYKLDQVSVYQLNYVDNKVVSGVSFRGLYPSNIGAMSFDQSGGSLVTFDVSFTYDYFDFEPGGSSSGSRNGGNPNSSGGFKFYNGTSGPSLPPPTIDHGHGWRQFKV